MAAAPHLRKSVPGSGGNPHRRMRPLIRLGQHAQVVKPEKLPLIGKPLLRPRLEDDFQGFLKARPAFGVGDSVAVIRAGETAAAHAELQPPPAYLIHSSRFLGQSYRMAQGQYAHPGANPHPLRPPGNGRGHHQRHRHHRRDAGPHGVARPARRRKMPFRQPHPIQAVSVRGLGQGKGFIKSRLLRYPHPVIALHYHANVHCASSCPDFPPDR